MKYLIPGILLLAATTIAGCNNMEQSATQTPVTTAGTIPAPAPLRINILNVYPHDNESYTQGLLVYKGQLYESTGGQAESNKWKSWVGKTDLKTGKHLSRAMLDKAYFGEGVTILGDKLYQLTWTSNIGFIYDPVTLRRTGEFPLKTEGWGITNDSTSLIVSDGTSNLYYLNPADFSTRKILGVSDNNGPVNNLNELEFINGYIYANRWQTNYILKIDPSNGQVVGMADLSNLLKQYNRPDFNENIYNNGDAVLNGIAYDPDTKKVYITGKLWPVMFETTIE
ncbi:glutaminyl-peptide cyclotransferase [Flavihumibacter stibioxidans]|uniref:Glutamine cyclotransferase n=1 Tax=Flavihumibacter stibioxidans TaxID=1834163 RepID=A0ABR7M4Z9_9BACT|nr:glutaminyl-peptide cyclotransferase [Flavihumibacter stibioxidans]MBC6489986.1 hypothetical protein [Flavihumibacter stibioxidans]